MSDRKGSEMPAWMSGKSNCLVTQEAQDLARGWRRTLEVLERLKRLDEGRPLVVLVRRSAPRSGA